jgi:diguanylate cyclase (GGDEF)-like protein
MAIVPLAISMALIYAVIGSQGLDVRARASVESANVSSAVVAQVQRTEGMLQVLAGDPGIGRAPVDEKALDRAGDSLRALGGSGGAIVAEASLADLAGVVRLQLVNGQVSVPSTTLKLDPDFVATTLALRNGGVARSATFRGPDGLSQVSLAMPLLVPGSTRSTGIVSFDISLAKLVTSVAPKLGDGTFTLLVDGANGAIVADSRSSASSQQPAPAGPADLAGNLAGIVVGSEDAWHSLLDQGWAAGSADVAATGANWSIVVLQPATAPTFPIQLVGMLGGLAVLVVGLSMWMSRQILRPAEQLETSRTELEQMYQAARDDSLQDTLTGLGNHRAFQEELDRQIDWNRRHRVPVSLLVIDVDDLKLTNDSKGHAAGDELLQWMGRFITEVTRYSDRAFRVGSDEFAILMPHTDTETALQVGRHLLQRAGSPRDGSPRVSFSGGIASCPGHATTREQLYMQADAALLWCKRHGRGAVDTYEPQRDLRSDPAASEEMAAAVVKIASERRLRAVFQPVVDLVTGNIIGYEGLIRPTDPAPFTNPGQMFEAAGAVGRTVELDTACFDVVAEAARHIAPDKIINLNLSPATIEAPDFNVTNVLASLAQHGMDPRRLVVEVTERERVQDMGRLRGNLLDLQAAGIRIAADDVGAGNAGLQLLSQFRFDIVKLDLSLVQDGAQRDSSHAVLRSLRDLAGRWGAFVVAEGIETREQLHMVRELGLSAGQGYLLGRPGTNVQLARIDLDALEAGGLLMQNPNAAAQRPAVFQGPTAA